MTMSPLLRAVLVLLIAVLLPLRGAVAGAMACAAPGSTSAVAVAALQGMDGHAAQHDGMAPYPDRADDEHCPATAGPHASADQCNLCAAAGGLTPLPATLPPWAAPATFLTLQFPPLAVTVTVFVTEGPERPPRAG